MDNSALIKCISVAMRMYSSLSKEFPSIEIWPIIEKKDSLDSSISLMFGFGKLAIGKINIWYTLSEECLTKGFFGIQLESTDCIVYGVKSDTLYSIILDEAEKLSIHPPIITTGKMSRFSEKKESWINISNLISLRFIELFEAIDETIEELDYDNVVKTIMLDVKLFLKIFEKIKAHSSLTPDEN